jgi:threonine dehydratase
MAGEVSIEAIRDARARARGIVRLTPLEPSATFTALCGRPVYLKLENLQKTGSFKVRGALNTLQRLGPEVRARGVITASAGNHAQGVAYAARTLGVRATVVMPETASFSKTAATIGYGAEVVLHGRDYAHAADRAAALAAERGAAFVHAYDDPAVIAGQGTVGLELLEQLPDVATVVVPVGGGGLIAGIAAALRASGSRAGIVAVQIAAAPGLRASLRAGHPVHVPVADTIADGLATGSVGAHPFAIIRGAVDDVIEVSEEETAAAVLLLLERAKIVVEGAGAVGLAACLAGRVAGGTGPIAVVISGGNIDINLLDRIITLGLVREGRRFRFTTELPDRPGELQRLVACVAARGANIHQIHHERVRAGLAPTRVAVTLELETRGPEHVADIARALAADGFTHCEAAGVPAGRA